MKVPVSDVYVPASRRALDLEKVKEIADSIREIGLLYPITIVKNDIPDAKEPWRLVAGRHRLEAARTELKQDEIEATVIDLDMLHQELAQIDENLMRARLHFIDEGEALARRKIIWGILYPETKVGGDRRSQEYISKSKRNDFKQKGFAQDAAAKRHVTPRTIHQEVQIATRLAGPVKDLVKKEDMQKAEVLRLTRSPPDEQMKLAKMIEAGEAKTVREAEKLLYKEKTIQRGRKAKVQLDALFEVGDYEELMGLMTEGSISAIVSHIPPGIDLEAFLKHSIRVLGPEGQMALQTTPGGLRQILAHIPEDLNYVWTIANLLSHTTDKPDEIRSSWLPVVLLAKNGIRQGGSDVIVRSSENLKSTEDCAVQIINRVSKPGDIVLDPFLGEHIMSLMAAHIGRKFRAISKDQESVDLAKGRLEALQGVLFQI